jgi:hypothetical protein
MVARCPKMIHRRAKVVDLDLFIDVEPARMMDDPPFGIQRNNSSRKIDLVAVE